MIEMTDLRNTHLIYAHLMAEKNWPLKMSDICLLLLLLMLFVVVNDADLLG